MGETPTTTPGRIDLECAQCNMGVNLPDTPMGHAMADHFRRDHKGHEGGPQ